MIHQEEFPTLVLRPGNVARIVVPIGLLEVIVRVENALGTVHAGAAFHSVAVGEEEHASVGVDELLHGGPGVWDGGSGRRRSRVRTS